MTKPLPQNYLRILRLIPEGADRPITNRELQDITKLTERTIREIIERLNTRYQIPIGSLRRNGQSGYYFPTDDSERLQAIAELQKQVSKEQARINIIAHGDLTKKDNYLKGVGAYV